MARPKTNDFPLYMCRSERGFKVLNPINKKSKKFRSESEARAAATLLAEYLNLCRPAKRRNRKIPVSRTRRYSRKYCSERKALIRLATPAWADRRAIAGIYTEARHLTLTTGIKHSVDHVIPLKGRLVCGLHVETNLAILSLTQNSQKHNAFDRDNG